MLNDSTSFQDNSGILGFDLGTTNSVVTSFDKKGVPVVLKSRSGNTTPSAVFFQPNGKLLIGREAYELSRTNPDVAKSFKKELGTDWLSPQGKSSYDTSKIFSEALMKEVLELNPKFKGINNIIVSVPAYFDLHQEDLVRQMFKELGYNVLYIQKEPVAAAILAQSTKRLEKPVLVYDLGGGTFDVVLMESRLGIPENSRKFYEKAGVQLPDIKQTLVNIDVSGNKRLGGDDIDEKAVDTFPDKSVPRHVIRFMAEQTKILGQDQPFTHDGKHFTFLFKWVEDATNFYVDETFRIIDKLLKDNDLEDTDVHVVLCGGSTKSPIIRERIGSRFEYSSEIDPDLAVSVGNSMTAYSLQKETGIQVINVLPKHVGIKLNSRFKPLLHKGATIPCETSINTTNSTPFAKNIEVDVYQSEDLLQEEFPIFSVVLKDVTGHDEQGKVKVAITIRILANNTLELETTINGEKKLHEMVISHATISQKAEDKHVKRIRVAIAKLEGKADHLKEEVEQLAQTPDNRQLRNKIMNELSRLAI